MTSAALRKSITDLSRRRARTFFTVLTLALAVSSISFFAIPTLIDRAMQEEVRVGRLADATLAMRPLPLAARDLAGLAALPNVAAVEPRSRVDARVLVGERRAPARVIGVRDFEGQTVDLVRVERGAYPERDEVLVEVQNANVGVYDAAGGDTVTLLGGGGKPDQIAFRVSGVGRSLPGGEVVQDQDLIVLYADAATVAALSGEQGYSELSFRLRDPTPAVAAQTVEAARRYLRTVPGFTGFTDLPETRAPGDWPGKADTEAFGKILGVITLLALLSALVLISNTMTTLVAEQTGEIGIMRAVGARRRQVARVYLTTALLFGALGALFGVALGVLVSSLLAGYFGTAFWAVDVPFGADWTVVAISVLVGLLAPPLAALPAIRRAVGTDLRAALESTGSAVGGQDAGDRLLRRARFLPRSAQIGLRGVGRRKRRSLATVVIVALAVANLLAVLGMAASVTEASRAGWGEHLDDLRVWTAGRQVFDERAARVIRSTPGVAEAEPALVNAAVLAGNDAIFWGVTRDPLLRVKMDEGRWFSAGEEQARSRVAVLQRPLADAAEVAVGQRVTLETAAGPVAFRIVGIADNRQEEGTALFVPLTTLQSVLGTPGINTYWVETTSPDHALVDRTMSSLEDRLGALGHEIGGEITYVAERDEIATNSSLTTTIALIGLLIVAMSMVGLANAITMSVIERTREVGILRCIGARARDVRRIFTTEGLVLALGGWLVGVPLGYALDRALVRLLKEIAAVEVPFVFPPWNLLIALGGTLVLALLITLVPIRRAVRLRPGDALRYA